MAFPRFTGKATPEPRVHDSSGRLQRAAAFFAIDAGTGACLHGYRGLSDRWDRPQGMMEASKAKDYSPGPRHPTEAAAMRPLRFVRNDVKRPPRASASSRRRSAKATGTPPASSARARPPGAQRRGFPRLQREGNRAGGVARHPHHRLRLRQRAELSRAVEVQEQREQRAPGKDDFQQDVRTRALQQRQMPLARAAIVASMTATPS